MTFLKPLVDVDQYEEWQQNQGRRPEVWQTAIAEVAREPTIIPPFIHRPSVIGLLAGIRLQSRTQIPSEAAITRKGSLEEAPRRPESLNVLVPRGATVTDAGWGDSYGVEAYPKSTAVPQNRH